MTYFRGVYNQETDKFEPYNDKYFKDLYFENNVEDDLDGK